MKALNKCTGFIRKFCPRLRDAGARTCVSRNLGPILLNITRSSVGSFHLPEFHFLADIEVEEVGRELDVGTVVFDLFVGADGVVRWHGYAPGEGS